MVAAFTPWNFPVLIAWPQGRRRRSAPAAPLIIKSLGRDADGRVRRWSNACFADAGLPPERACNVVFGVPAESVRAYLMTKDAGHAQDLVHRLDAGRQAPGRARGGGA